MSHWSAPLNNRMNVHQRRMFALAAIRLRKFFKRLVLVTDTPGAAILIEQLNLPFDEVALTLDCITPRIRKIWALGKLLAYAHLDTPFIHFDWDVILSNRLPGHILNAKLCVEKVEGVMGMLHSKWVDHFEELPLHWIVGLNLRAQIDWNCGIFGGRDVARIKHYALESYSIAHQIIDKLEAVHEDGGVLSRFFEQWAIGRYWTREEITMLCPDGKRAPGYYHMQGSLKNLPANRLHICETLLRESPETALRALDLSLPWR